MATNDEDKDYRDALVKITGDLARQLGAVREQLGAVREQMSRDLADYLARYREDVSRSINALHYRVQDVEDALGRLASTLVDLKADVEAIRNSQRGRNWQQWAQLILLVLLLVVMGALLWQLR